MKSIETTIRTRRDMLGLLGGLGAVIVVAGCGGDGTKNASSSTSSKAAATTTTTAAAGTSSAAGTTCVGKIPTETAGPFPADGSNGPNILTQDGVVRRDITSSIGSASGVAEGLPLTVNLTIVDSGNGCQALPRAAVYIWHCDRDGLYSMYSGGAPDENYLRGVQAADADGSLTFTSIFPGAYSGRWPHIHFEVFSSLDEATDGANAITVSQIALPAETCQAAYATDGYEESVRNLSQTSLRTDNIFSDGADLQTATMTGDATNGYTATLVVGV